MKVLSVAFLLCSAQLAWGADSIVIGTLSYNEPMEYAPDECPKDYICLRSWWKSIIRVKKTVRGPLLSGSISTAVMQHTSLNPRYRKSVRLFVLRPITDPAERAKLRVQFYLEEMAVPAEMYCFNQDPKEYGLNVEQTYVAGDDDKVYCFELPSG
jgi:hypothetical protein